MGGKVDSYGETSITIYGDDGHIYYYTHLTAGSVPTGGRVAAGDQIGTFGPSGQGTVPHLHFDISKSTALGGMYDTRRAMSRTNYNEEYAASFVSPKDTFEAIWGTDRPR